MEHRDRLLHRLEQIVDRVDDGMVGKGGHEPVFYPALFERFIAFRWERSGLAGTLVPKARVPMMLI